MEENAVHSSDFIDLWCDINERPPAACKLNKMIVMVLLSAGAQSNNIIFIILKMSHSHNEVNSVLVIQVFLSQHFNLVSTSSATVHLSSVSILCPGCKTLQNVNCFVFFFLHNDLHRYLVRIIRVVMWKSSSVQSCTFAVLPSSHAASEECKGHRWRDVEHEKPVWLSTGQHETTQTRPHVPPRHHCCEHFK